MLGSVVIVESSKTDLGVVGHRAVGIDRDRHRAHAQEAERHQAERKHRRRDHQFAEPCRLTPVGDRHQADDRQPIQKPLKLPAVRPDRILSDAPPSRDDVHHFLHVSGLVEVKTFTSSGIIAPASVPQEMIVESFHHSVPSPSRSGIKQIGHAHRSRRPK